MSDRDERLAPGLEQIVDALVAAGDALPEPPRLPTAATVQRETLAERRPDPLNAIVRDVRVVGSGDGPLRGLRVTLKDCIACAGVPMTAGSAALEGFVPTGDATVTRRLLDAGAEIVAITNMDDLAFSGGGDSSRYGAVLNPFDRTRLAGGSSGGAAASLHYDGIDVAVGTDQGGSVRVPAAWCGVLGLKPTRGLVPYTGVVAMEPSLDHVGLLARDPDRLERTLDALVGPDGRDPRPSPATLDAYRDPANDPRPLAGSGVIVPEPLLAVCDDAVREAFERDLAALAEHGVRITRSPWDPSALGPISTGLFVAGLAATLAGHPANGTRDEQPWVELTRALQRGVREHRTALGPAVAVTLRAAERLARTRPGDARARATAAAGTLRRQLDGLLADGDLLLAPTTPCLPFAPTDDPAERVARGWRVLTCTGPANVTGHPAISVPGTTVDGLPTGLMLVGRAGSDRRLVGAARELAGGVGPGHGAGSNGTTEVKHVEP